MGLYDDIYASLLGQFVDGKELPWVPNVFAEGSPCWESYCRILEARDRVQKKLGGEDDEDLDTMLMEMEDVQYRFCMEILKLRRF